MTNSKDKQRATKRAVATKKPAKKTTAKRPLKKAPAKKPVKASAKRKAPSAKPSKTPSGQKKAPAEEEAPTKTPGEEPSPAPEPYLGARYEPPTFGEVWCWEDYWFYGTNGDARPPGYSVWRKDTFAETKHRIGHMFRSRSGFALFLFEKEKTPLPWFLGFFVNTSAAADELVKHEA